MTQKLVMEPSRLALVLQNLLEKRDISVSELARRIKIPQPTIQRIANGVHSRPHQKTINAIAGFFNISSDQLRGMVPLPEPLGILNVVEKIPILNSNEVLDWPNFSRVKQFIISDKKLEKNSYAIKMIDSSMEPLIRKNALVIIEPCKIPSYRSFVVVKLHNHTEILIRQFIQNGKNTYIKALSSDFNNSEIIQLQKDDKILGVIVEIRIEC